MIYHRELEPSDLAKFRTIQLRQADINEIKASVGVDPNIALIRSVERSDWVRVILVATSVAQVATSVAQIEDEIVGVFGLSGVAPWFLATDRIYEYKLTFLRQSKRIVGEMLQRTEVLMNFVDSRHIEAIQWLLWLGFKIDFDNPTVIGGVKFYLFTRRK